MRDVESRAPDDIAEELSRLLRKLLRLFREDAYELKFPWRRQIDIAS